jgi:hypothetical protein
VPEAVTTSLPTTPLRVIVGAAAAVVDESYV